MSKHREWWIHSTGNAYTRDVSSEFPVVHVVEYEAYLSALAAIGHLRRASKAVVAAMMKDTSPDQFQSIRAFENLAHALSATSGFGEGE